MIKKLKKYLTLALEYVYINRFLWAAIISLGFSSFILPLSEEVAFNTPELGDGNFLYSYTLKFFFVLLLYAASVFFIHFFYKILVEKLDFYRKWGLYSFVYLAFSAVILLLMYPGHWVWDEFSVLEQVKLYLPFSWQGNLTSVFYTFSLYLFPSAIAIVAAQLFIASLVIGYVTSLFQEVTKRRYLPFVFMLFFLAAPIILNNIYPLRLTIYSYVELFLLARFASIALKMHTPTHKGVELILVGVLIGILCSWRSEGIYYILLLPIYAYYLGLISRSTLRNPGLYISLIASIASIWLLVAYSRSNAHPLYPVTATINPIANMLQSELKGDRINESLEAIDKVIDIEVVKGHPSYDEIPSFWQPNAIRDGYEDHLGGYNDAFLYLVLNNPYEFLKSKFFTFMSTNSFGARQSLPSGVFGSTTNTDLEKAEKFNAENKFTNPINISVKKQLTSFLLPPTASQSLSVGHLVWSIIPIMTGLLVIMIYAIVKRQVIIVIIIAFILARVPLIFLTAPANYFMYYLPVYISGGALLWAMLLIGLSYIIHRNKKTGKQHTQTVHTAS